MNITVFFSSYLDTWKLLYSLYRRDLVLSDFISDSNFVLSNFTRLLSCLEL